MVIVPYYPIRDEALKLIIQLKLGKIKRRLMENHRIELLYDSALIDAVASRCTEVESGARNVDNVLDQLDAARRLAAAAHSTWPRDREADQPARRRGRRRFVRVQLRRERTCA